MAERPKTKLPPHVYVYTSNRDNPKVARLTDAEYRAWIYALGSARGQVPAGQWPSRDYLVRALGDYAVHLDRLVALDLIRVYKGGVYFSTNWSVNQPGIASESQRLLEASYDAWKEHKRRGAKARQDRRRSRGDAHLSRTSERGADALHHASLLDASLRDSSLHDESLRSSAFVEPVTLAADAASLPPGTHRGRWEPVPCAECGGILADRDEAYEGDAPDYRHLGGCP